MLSTLLVAALAATGMQDTDTTLPASGVSRVQVEQHNGSVVVRAWDRDEIRVQADHSRRAEIEIRRRGGTVLVETDAMPHVPVHYTISIPARMDLDVEGLKLETEVHGVEGEVVIESVQGGATVRSGAGNLDIETLSGPIEIEDFDGDVSATSVAQHIRMRNVRGAVVVEAVSGLVDLFDMVANSLDVEAVSGSIGFSGSLAPGGHHSLSSHSGQITLDLVEGLNLTLEISSHSGSVDMDYPNARLIESGHGEMLFEIGRGGTIVEIETFSGSVRIRERGR